VANEPYFAMRDDDACPNKHTKHGVSVIIGPLVQKLTGNGETVEARAELYVVEPN
jgi:hypothetical protein